MSRSAEVNVRDLAIDRDHNEAPRITPKRRIFSRVVLPALMIVSFVSVLGWAARDIYLPRAAVSVIPVHISQSELPTGGRRGGIACGGRPVRITRGTDRAVGG